MGKCEYFKMYSSVIKSNIIPESQQTRSVKTVSKPCCTSPDAKHTEIHIDIASTSMGSELRCNGDISKCQLQKNK